MRAKDGDDVASGDGSFGKFEAMPRFSLTQARIARDRSVPRITFATER
jgi:hypothetical protein